VSDRIDASCYFRSISLSSPQITALAYLCSSRSIKQLAEGPSLRVAPELADPVGPLEVGGAEDETYLPIAPRHACEEAQNRSASTL
jgi:hypothetical protein